MIFVKFGGIAIMKLAICEVDALGYEVLKCSESRINDLNNKII